MISYKRDVLDRQSLSEVKMGRGSPICERVRKKIVEYFKNNVPQRQIAKALQISSSTVHNIIKRFRETGEISVRKGQGEDLCWMPVVFGPSDDTEGPKCHRVLWAKAHLKWTVSKWKSVLWSDESKFDILVGNHRRCVLRAKEEGDLPEVLSAFSSKASISDGMGVHKCIRYGQLACFGRHYECWKVCKGFRATYAPLQTTSISVKALCISAGQCKTSYCSYYNSMAS